MASSALVSMKSGEHSLHICTATSPALVADSTYKDPDIRVYPYRFVILILFCLYSLSNGFQWIELSIIHDVIKRHISYALL
ncbi:feline leukemia virus subgroup C receptor-related protein 1-like [Tropilaelaps mercedesae]|uniref:Feline leukemia virus subgroup C receptor-related protein 1-like n=1 Tax=Tropilaelaps mercedesae TaxID=418985 RepID=A0A1V9XYS2_9ACAR|nr:feline leukemia virus subgroup C receptor-related protein 1-like [Tropilaelaps mercedesae]